MDGHQPIRDEIERIQPIRDEIESVKSYGKKEFDIESMRSVTMATVRDSDIESVKSGPVGGDIETTQCDDGVREEEDSSEDIFAPTPDKGTTTNKTSSKDVEKSPTTGTRISPPTLYRSRGMDIPSTPHLPAKLQKHSTPLFTTTRHSSPLFPLITSLHLRTSPIEAAALVFDNSFAPTPNRTREEDHSSILQRRREGEDSSILQRRREGEDSTPHRRREGGGGKRRRCRVEIEAPSTLPVTQFTQPSLTTAPIKFSPPSPKPTPVDLTASVLRPTVAHDQLDGNDSPLLSPDSLPIIISPDSPELIINKDASPNSRKTPDNTSDRGGTAAKGPGDSTLLSDFDSRELEACRQYQIACREEQGGTRGDTAEAGRQSKTSGVVSDAQKNVSKEQLECEIQEIESQLEPGGTIESFTCTPAIDFGVLTCTSLEETQCDPMVTTEVLGHSSLVTMDVLGVVTEGKPQCKDGIGRESDEPRSTRALSPIKLAYQDKPSAAAQDLDAQSTRPPILHREVETAREVETSNAEVETSCHVEMEESGEELFEDLGDNSFISSVLSNENSQVDIFSDPEYSFNESDDQPILASEDEQEGEEYKEVGEEDEDSQIDIFE
eukprot:sb/3463136/